MLDALHNRKQSQFISMTDDSNDRKIENVPVLTERDMYFIAQGHYPIHQERSYYGEHLSSYGRLSFELCFDPTLVNFTSHGLIVGNPLLIRARLQSRHINKTKYYLRFS